MSLRARLQSRSRGGGLLRPRSAPPHADGRGL